MPRPLIILGASARAAAQSARRADYEPWCIDLFADRDLRRIATARVCPARDYPSGMLPLLGHAPVGAPVLLTGAMENYPQVVRAVALERPLLGSSVEAIERVRDPGALPTLPTTKGLRFCKVRRWGTGALLSMRRYLIKPRRSAGGVGIARWSPGQRVDREHFLQQFVAGVPYSAVFHADGWSATLLGVTEQLIGDAVLGAVGFRYCGSLGPVELDESARAALLHLAVQLTQRYDVRGVFGVDLVRDGRGTFWPIEVNPRYVASIEVIERALGVALLADHRSHHQRPRQWHGKAIVFAQQDVETCDLYEHFEDHQIADVPDAEQRVRRGRPICTVFATGHDREACLAMLRERAAGVHACCGARSGSSRGEAR